MFVLRCTRKLLDRIGPPSAVTEPSTTTLGDWFAQPFSVGRRRFILLACERSRQAVLMPGRDVRHLAQNFPGALAEVLVRLGASAPAVRRETGEMRECVIAATNNRSLLGTLNDFSFLLKWRLEDEPDGDLVDAALWLSGTPVGPLGRDTPGEVTLRLLAEGSTGASGRVDRHAPPADDPITSPPTYAAPNARGEQKDRSWTGDTWITDMRHFLDESGAMPEMPGPALSLALFLGAIVAWVTSGRMAADERTNVPCRRIPGRRRCRGVIEAALAADGETVLWRCPVCGDNGKTRGWEETPWDRRGGGDATLTLR